MKDPDGRVVVVAVPIILYGLAKVALVVTGAYLAKKSVGTVIEFAKNVTSMTNSNTSITVQENAPISAAAGQNKRPDISSTIPASAATGQGKDDNNINAYLPPPKTLPGLPDTIPVKPKTPVQGGGGLRKRWKDGSGNIYEWDSQHGEVEKYNSKGKHKGAYDPNTGEKIKEPKPDRTVES